MTSFAANFLPPDPLLDLRQRSSSATPTRVLVVDDTASIHEDFRKILRSTKSIHTVLAELHGARPVVEDPVFEVTCVHQGQDGFAAVQESVRNARPFAVAFVDMRMPPGWDGVETIARLWSVDPDLQVVLCTAYSDYSWAEITQRLGVSDRLVILKKPFDVIEVLHLAHVMAEKRGLLERLRGHMANLEQTVAQRTRELIGAQAQLLADIARRKQVELELRKLSRAVDQSPVSIVITDTSGTIDYVNPRFCALTGYGLEEVRGKNARILKSGEMPVAVYRELWAVITGGDEWSGRLHNKKKNGERYWESAVISPIRNEAGDITHFVAVKEDITEKKKAETALRESEERHRSLFERSLECMFVHDFEGRLLDLNPAAFALLGYGREELASLTLASLLPPADVPRARAVVETVRSVGAQAGVTEFMLVRCDKSLVPVETKSSLVMREGRPYAVQTMARDITERRRADDAMRSQLVLRERLAKIAANAPGIIYTFRLRADGSSCMPYASPMIAELFGVQPADWTEDAAPFFELVPSDERALLRASIAESARTMASWRAEFQVQHPAKGLLWIEGQATPEREPDGGTLWHGFMSDISERKRTARELVEHKDGEERSRRALEQERELNLVKSRFVSLVSHEFRSPLCVINMAAALMADYLERMTAEERSGNIRQIQRAVARMTQMMEDLLLHEKMNCGKIENTPDCLDLELLCSGLAEEFPNRREMIDCVIAPEASHAFVDERILLHILGNLVGNAVKYSADEQRVMLSVKRVAPVGVANGADWLLFEVSDSGIGIPEADLENIFQTFHRSNNVGNRPGTGMGLAIVKQFVDLLEGMIEVDSRVDQGTRVRVFLPIAYSIDEYSAGSENDAPLRDPFPDL